MRRSRASIARGLLALGKGSRGPGGASLGACRAPSWPRSPRSRPPSSWPAATPSGDAPEAPHDVPPLTLVHILRRRTGSPTSSPPARPARPSSRPPSPAGPTPVGQEPRGVGARPVGHPALARPWRRDAHGGREPLVQPRGRDERGRRRCRAPPGLSGREGVDARPGSGEPRLEGRPAGPALAGTLLRSGRDRALRPIDRRRPRRRRGQDDAAAHIAALGAGEPRRAGSTGSLRAPARWAS